MKCMIEAWSEVLSESRTIIRIDPDILCSQIAGPDGSLPWTTDTEVHGHGYVGSAEVRGGIHFSVAENLFIVEKLDAAD